MLQFVIRRILVAIPVLFGVTLLAFSVIHLIPGDPAQIMLFGSNPTPALIQHLRVELGLTQPYPIQYLVYLGRARSAPDRCASWRARFCPTSSRTSS
jgi:peptide/nickel transport system permease protein